ncbi:MAG: SpoIIE family protein phosphatase [Epsilonproteobacteria bacterium]|nr:SpoIIE family protein phosphatase [Campylobacterota bacterium]
MRKKLVLYYKKLSLVQRLSIPLLIASLFGFLLTIVIAKQVHHIQNHTASLEDAFIPALEKSTNNMALLKSISEKLTFATLTEEEEMIWEISENKIIENNLNDMIHNEGLTLRAMERYLNEFQDYFKVATQYSLNVIKNSSLNDEGGVSAEELLIRYNGVKKNFMQINFDIERKIAYRTNLINEMSREVIYYTIIYLVVFSTVLFFTSYINYQEFNDYEIIESQKRELSKVNRNIQSSIEYASLIQEAILPSNDILDGYTKDNFVFWKQKDTVGGDIYLMVELESKNEILVMVIDGVGHGVSGAFLTILTKALKVQIIEQINQGVLEPSPALILKYFNNSIKTILKQEKSSKSNVGFDGGVLYYNRATNRCRYAGAKTPLYIVNNNQLEVIQSDRKSVGFIRTKMNQEYTEYNIEINNDTKLYISTDGITDQEGADNCRYGKDRFEKFILDNHQKTFAQQLELLKDDFQKVKGDLEQSDDITVVGLEFK